MTAQASTSRTPLISRDRLDALLDEARGRRVAIVGDAMLDVYLRGDVDRISPEAPVPVVRVRSRTLALGGAANVAQNVAAAKATLTSEQRRYVRFAVHDAEALDVARERFDIALCGWSL